MASHYQHPTQLDIDRQAACQIARQENVSLLQGFIFMMERLIEGGELKRAESLATKKLSHSEIITMCYAAGRADWVSKAKIGWTKDDWETPSFMSLMNDRQRTMAIGSRIRFFQKFSTLIPAIQ